MADNEQPNTRLKVLVDGQQEIWKELEASQEQHKGTQQTISRLETEIAKLCQTIQRSTEQTMQELQILRVTIGQGKQNAGANNTRNEQIRPRPREESPLQFVDSVVSHSRPPALDEGQPRPQFPEEELTISTSLAGLWGSPARTSIPATHSFGNRSFPFQHNNHISSSLQRLEDKLEVAGAFLEESSMTLQRLEQNMNVTIQMFEGPSFQPTSSERIQTIFARFDVEREATVQHLEDERRKVLHEFLSSLQSTLGIASSEFSPGLEKIKNDCHNVLDQTSYEDSSKFALSNQDTSSWTSLIFDPGGLDMVVQHYLLQDASFIIQDTSSSTILVFDPGGCNVYKRVAATRFSHSILINIVIIIWVFDPGGIK